MKGGNLSRYKRTKFGQLPGDISIRGKALMIEKGIRGRSPGVEQTVEGRRRCAKTFKRDFVRIANRRARRAPVETDGL